MIVQPDFPEHWKTRQLVQLTGDDSSPLAVIRLWAHCQSNRRWRFPNMTKEQLASVCKWDHRKPPCHVALVKAGFVEKMTPKGFVAHQWDEHNGQLTQKWHAGQKGGRPSASEKTNEKPDSEKPTDNRPITDQVQAQPSPDQTSQAEIDQTSQAQNEQAKAPTDTPALLAQLRASVDAAPDGGMGGNVAAVEMDGREDGGTDGIAAINRLASSVAQKLTPRCGVPSLQEVRTYLIGCFDGAANYAEPFYKTMEKQHWKDKQRRPITDWKAMAKAYASKAHSTR